MQHNQVFVIQVSSGPTSNKHAPLALPAAAPGPEPPVLPSEVKYSASLVRGLGWAHLFLGSVLFLLGVLGTWVEPETCWAGAGVWTGLAALLCGFSGLVAHCFWYKNFSIKAFLVSSVVCLVLSVLAVVLSIYAIVNRHQHFQTLLAQMDEHSWFQPYDLNQEHRLTLSISVNLLVGFFLELVLALWSSRVGWRGVQTPEFSASKRDDDVAEQNNVTPLPPRPGQQVPLAALYQLLQAHPEMLGNKGVEAGLVPPWMSGGLGDHPTHHSMDYQERVSRFLSHAIEDQNPCLGRPLSALQSDARDSATASTSSGGRCSPTDTLPMLPPDQAHSGRQGREMMEREMQERDTAGERKEKQTHVDTLHNRDTGSTRKVKHTHVDTLLHRDTGSQRKVKQAYTDTLPNGDTANERRVKQTHIDILLNGDTASEQNAKQTQADTLRSRRGSEHKPKAPAPKVKNNEGSRSSETSTKCTVKDEPIKCVDVNNEINHKEEKSEMKREESNTVDKVICENSHKVEKIERKREGLPVVDKVITEKRRKEENGEIQRVELPVADKIICEKSHKEENGGMQRVELPVPDKIICEKSHKEENGGMQRVKLPVDADEKTDRKDKQKSVTEMPIPQVHSKKQDKAEKHKKKKSKREAEGNNQDMKPKSNPEEVNGHMTENMEINKSLKEEKREKKERKEKRERKERKEKRHKDNKGDEKNINEGNSGDLHNLASSIQPPCEFQDT